MKRFFQFLYAVMTNSMTPDEYRLKQKFQTAADESIRLRKIHLRNMKPRVKLKSSNRSM